MEENIGSITDPADTIREGLGLSRSIVFSGERWSPQADDAFRDALAALDRLVAREAELEAARDQAIDSRMKTNKNATEVLADVMTRWEAERETTASRVQQLEDALRAVKKFASDPFASEAVALRACLLEANEALGIPGPEPSPLRDLAKEIIDAALETQ